MISTRLRLLISSVLLLGVSASAALIAVGFIGSLLVGWRGSLVGSQHIDVSITEFGGLLDGLLNLRPQAIAQLGLVMLIATPIMRVVASLVGFAASGDRAYVLISGVVLGILLLSILVVR